MMHRFFRRLAGAWADRALVRRVSDLEIECADLRAQIIRLDTLLGESVARETRAYTKGKTC
jgi:hypothetical protein